MTDDYFARHPIRLASAWPSVEIALLNGDLPQGTTILPETSHRAPDPTTPTPENGDHAQEEKSREDHEG